MFGVVEAKATDSADVGGGERGKKGFHFLSGDVMVLVAARWSGPPRRRLCTYGNLVGHIVGAEDVAFDDTGLGNLGDIADASRQDCIAVVCLSVFRKEADEAL